MDFGVGRLVPFEDHPIESVSEKNAPRLFSEGSFLLQNENLEGLKTAADWSSINLRDSMELSSGISLKCAVQKCDPATLPKGESCASDEELKNWFAANKLFIVTSQNYVDYNEVNLIGNHISSFVEPLESYTIKVTDNPQEEIMLRFRFTEK